MKKKLITSVREFRVLISENMEYTVKELTLDEVINNKQDYEFMYAMEEIIDDILDLKKGDQIYFQPNRDDKNSKGIILRYC